MMGCYASLSAQTNSREQQFINENFPHYRLCDWTPGMKFMCLPERKDILLPVFKSVDTDREVSMGPLKRKIL